MTRDEAKQLLDKYLMGTATPEEQTLVERAYTLYGEGKTGALTHFDSEKLLLDTLGTSLLEHAQGNGARGTHTPELELPGKRRLQWWPYAAAVAVAILFVVGWLLLDVRQETLDNRLAGTEVLPVGNRATLTLADGRVVELSGTQDGIVVGDEDIRYQDGSSVLESRVENQESRLHPATGSEEHVGSLGSQVLPLASITTPKGGTYSITLPDGSKVWLNAASTLKYPERFDGEERVVELIGEAYFEVVRSRKVAKSQSREGSEATQQLSASAHQRFKVVTKGQTVEVLGTSFNISAYADESETKTTLVEGKVKIIPSLRGGGTTTRQSSSISDEIASVPASGRAQRTTHRMPRNDGTVLNPGEQSTLSNGTITKQQVDTDQFTAWKDGRILLYNADIGAVIRQLERWYDVTFDVRDWPAGLVLEGEINRGASFQAVLEVLQINTGKKLMLKGRRVMEQP